VRTARFSEWSSRRKAELNAFVNEAKSGPCGDCSKSFIPAAGRPCEDCDGVFVPLLMDWDHRPEEEKMFDISSAVSGGWRLDRIKAEIEKCSLVCCWCHVSRTMARREGGVLSRTG
jgi:hypothetical protein